MKEFACQSLSVSALRLERGVAATESRAEMSLAAFSFNFLESCSTFVTVISRIPQSNRLPKVDYHAGHISAMVSLRTLIAHIRPSVIVHTASSSTVSASAKDFEATTIQGT